MTTEAEKSGLFHPTPIAIKLACYEAADRLNAERRENGLPPISPEWIAVVRMALRIANEEHHGPS